MQLKWILAVIVAASAAVQAQELKSTKKTDDQPQAVTNEDRGQAFIITGEMKALSGRGHHESVIIEPQQNSIFLGSGWAADSARAREPELANLLANVRDQAQLTVLDQYGIKNFFAATSNQEKLDDLAATRGVSDLQIQSMLSGMLKEGSLQRPGANTIYVVFLDPGIPSTLGTMMAGKHYVAYHNFFNTSGVRIHYVVVPFEPNQDTAYQIALRAFVAAALNPIGAG